MFVLGKRNVKNESEEKLVLISFWKVTVAITFLVLVAICALFPDVWEAVIRFYIRAANG